MGAMLVCIPDPYIATLLTSSFVRLIDFDTCHGAYYQTMACTSQDVLPRLQLILRYQFYNVHSLPETSVKPYAYRTFTTVQADTPMSYSLRINFSTNSHWLCLEHRWVDDDCKDLMSVWQCLHLAIPTRLHQNFMLIYIKRELLWQASKFSNTD